MKFLGRAKKFLQDLGTEAPSTTQTFNLACASGHRVRGERTEGYQALRCPACGEGVFVLPRSPLPEPIAPAGVPETRKAQGRSRSPWVDEGPVEFDDGRSGGDGADIIWDDEPVEASPQGTAPMSGQIAPEDLAAAEIEEARRAECAPDRAESDVRRADRPGARRDTARTGRRRPDGHGDGASAPRESTASPGTARSGRPGRKRTAAVESRQAPVVVEARPRARRGPRIGVIFFLLTLLIVASVGWRMWRNRRAQDPIIAQQGREEGIPALEAGEFDRAYQLLSAARSAVDALGDDVEGAGEIRQAADEATIYVNLCPDKLEDLLADAGRTGRDDWDAKFDKLYKGQFFLFDTRIRETPESGGTGAYQIEYVVFPPGEASRFGGGGLAQPDRFAEIDLAGFELFETIKLGRADKVTFGARLQSIGYDSAQKQWTIHLDSKSGVFITHHGALRAVGKPDSESIELPKEELP